jgi:hypothetical protein
MARLSGVQKFLRSIGGTAGRSRPAVLLIAACLVSVALPAPGLAQDDFMSTQFHRALDTLQDPAAANSRVRHIWTQLAAYSGHRYPVLPAQQFDAGNAQAGYIYLDVSIAGDPHESVTRFFLAHEWGHEENGDPLTGMISAIFVPIASNPDAEDNADRYAATFMSRHNDDIRPALTFLCNLPDGGPSDTHSPGPDRAEHLAEVYGYTSDYACPTESADDLLEKEVKDLVRSSETGFRFGRKNRASGETRFSTPITINEHDSACVVSDGADNIYCKVDVRYEEKGESESAEDAFDSIENAIDSAFPDFTKDDDTRTSLVKAVSWSKHAGDPLTVIALEWSSTESKDYITLEFNSPEKP